MRITVSARNTEISPALREATETKIGRLARRVSGLDRAEVHFVEERNPRISDKDTCEVSLVGSGQHAWSKASAPDGFAAVDRVVDKLEQQLQRAKTKELRRTSGLAPRRPLLNGAEPDSEGAP